MKRALLVLLAAAACARPPEGPPEIRLGRDACAVCGMLVSEARFAAAWRGADGAVNPVDDVGEMLNAARETPAILRDAWVRSFETEAWLPAARAVYVRDGQLATPMGTGVAVFADAARAEAFLKSRSAAGPPLNLPDALRTYAREPRQR